jgi:hypothetical protein
LPLAQILHQQAGHAMIEVIVRIRDNAGIIRVNNDISTRGVGSD